MRCMYVLYALCTVVWCMLPLLYVVCVVHSVVCMLPLLYVVCVVHSSGVYVASSVPCCVRAVPETIDDLL